MRKFSRPLAKVAGATVACGLVLAIGPQPVMAQQKSTPAAATPPRESAQVEADALDALKEMSAFLSKLNSFEVHADSTVDLVTQNGHRVQLGGVSDYKVRRPAGFRIDVTTKDKRITARIRLKPETAGKLPGR